MPSSDPSVSLPRRYAIAVAFALGALALQWLIRPWVQTRVPFLFFFPAAVFASTIAGRGPGIVVLLCGMASALAWLPLWGPAASEPADRFSLLAYLVFGAVFVVFGARLRLTSQRAAAAEERLVQAIQDTGIGLFEIDLVERTGYVSPSLARLVGLPVSAAPVPIDQWLSRLPSESVAESQRVLVQKFRERAQGYELESAFKRSDGTPGWLLLRVHIVWKGERAVRLRGAGIDMTQSKAMAAQLEKTQGELSQQVEDLNRLHELSSRLPESGSLQKQLQMILRTVVDFHDSRRGLLWLLDPESGRLHLEASIGFGDAAVAQLQSMRSGEGACGLACEHGERTVIEDTEHDARFERWRDFARQEGFRSIHSTPLISQHARVLGALSVHMEDSRAPTPRERTLADICARKAVTFIERARAQAALEETQGRFQTVLEASTVPFTVMAPVRDAQGLIADFFWTFLNSAAARLIGGTVDSLLNRRVLDVLPGFWDYTGILGQYAAVADKGETREFEFHSTRNGLEGWFRCIAWPMRGSVAVWLADITERKKHEQLLQEADRRKDEFLATLAHELRNPLAPIRQAALLSKAPNATEAQKRWSHEVIDRQVQHMALLLDDLLDVSRITRGVLSLRKSRTELAAVIEAAIETARPLIDSKRHRLAVKLPPQPVYLEVDALRISQVVANLLTNAAKYTDAEGHISLEAGVREDGVFIDVSDNGIGIAAESMPDVFKMFTQLGAAGDRSGGLGIGLALTKGLVELHGGSVGVRSAGLGLGSTFSVRLPFTAEQNSTLAAPSNESARPSVVRKILIADDNRDAAQSLAVLLELNGHHIALAFDGEEALAAYRRFQPDTCLLDIGMPRLTGNEVARAIRRLPGGERPVLIAITGWGQEHDKAQALTAGFDHHMTKPVDPQRLTRLVVADLPQRPATPQADAPGDLVQGGATA